MHLSLIRFFFILFICLVAFSCVNRQTSSDLWLFPRVNSLEDFASTGSTPEKCYGISTWRHIMYIAQSPDLLAQCYYLTQDISFPRPGSRNPEDSEDSYSSRGFQPIGSQATPFTGHFDGKGNSLLNFFIDHKEESHLGLFAFVKDARIENLTIELYLTTGPSIRGDSYVGALAGRVEDSEIYNVHTQGGVIRATRIAGGLIGSQVGGFVAESSNASSIEGTHSLGGIVGHNQGRIQDSLNKGSLTGRGAPIDRREIGGIAGYNRAFLERNHNMADISGTENVGGIAGYNYYGSAIENTNEGLITGRRNVGGISGGNTGKIRENRNRGHVRGTSTVGGISGWNNRGGLISGSVNMESVEGIQNIGGIVGHNYYALVERSHNTATITGRKNIGGIAGIGHRKVDQSFNAGKITGRDNVGGIIGTSSGIVAESSNHALVAGKEKVGGIAGKNDGGRIERSKNLGSIRSIGRILGPQNTGGLTGYNSGTISESRNAFPVRGITNVGGISGFNSGTITHTSNTASIEGKNKIGGITGENFLGTLTQSYNTGPILGRKRVGGVAGEASGSLKQVYNTGSVEGTTYLGGIAGFSSSNISFVYNAGTIVFTSKKDVGAITGRSEGNITSNIYWDETSFVQDSTPNSAAISATENIRVTDTGYYDSRGTGDIADDVEIFINWDFDNTDGNIANWRSHGDGQWPSLYWQEVVLF